MNKPNKNTLGRNLKGTIYSFGIVPGFFDDIYKQINESVIIETVYSSVTFPASFSSTKILVKEKVNEQAK